ncbi:alpha/beta hydrolase-fold protein [Actinoplanes oblitus]|uniref:Alpha/beta hydrolase-fold protein n=1 Tax=Actinoplanes oblitus TaxID=3040509 RepID=A0ABY8WB40_9ACTN|nr:alpha/beta hydrolase-fold protein [Actinoplanes oblitus]WIM93614.1 alpha/beta hydrolase-fold protein [Actinoplanes oblitus]
MRLNHRTLASKIIGSDLPYTVLTPPDWSPEEALPLVQVLHGANSSAEVLAMMQPIAEGIDLPRALIACVSTPTVGGFYLGPWERVVADELPAEFNVTRIALLGSSMGGFGALRIAFADPRRYSAVAAISPALIPEGEPRARNTLSVLAQLAEETDEDVPRRLRANADAIRAGGLPIMLRCGDRDVFNMHDGTEQLHRLLWDLDIAHDYHLVRDGDHLGPEATASLRAAFAFVAGALTPPSARDRELEQAWRDWQTAGKPGDPPHLDAFGPSASTAVRVMMADDLAEAARRDPTAARRYGVLR